MSKESETNEEDLFEQETRQTIRDWLERLFLRQFQLFISLILLAIGIGMVALSVFGPPSAL